MYLAPSLVTSESMVQLCLLHTLHYVRDLALVQLSLQQLPQVLIHGLNEFLAPPCRERNAGRP